VTVCVCMCVRAFVRVFALRKYVCEYLCGAHNARVYVCLCVCVCVCVCVLTISRFGQLLLCVRACVCMRCVHVLVSPPLKLNREQGTQ